jgi:hypothetical protein
LLLLWIPNCVFVQTNDKYDSYLGLVERFSSFPLSILSSHRDTDAHASLSLLCSPLLDRKKSRRVPPYWRFSTSILWNYFRHHKPALL